MSVGKASIQRVSGAKKATEAAKEEVKAVVVEETPKKPAAKATAKVAAKKPAAKAPVATAKKPAAKKPAAKPVEKKPEVAPAEKIDKKEEAKIPAIRLYAIIPETMNTNTNLSHEGILRFDMKSDDFIIPTL